MRKELFHSDFSDERIVCIFLDASHLCFVHDKSIPEIRQEGFFVDILYGSSSKLAPFRNCLAFSYISCSFEE